MMFSNDEFEEFKAEAFEILDTAEKKLLSIGEGLGLQEAFDSVFRCFHNLKGASGMMELLDLQAHVHELETILMGFKDQTTMPKKYVDLFLSGIDASRFLLDGKKVSFNYQINGSETPVETNSAVSGSVPEQSLAASLNQPEANLAPSGSAVEEFLSECGEIIERVSSALAKLEASPQSHGLLNDLYRDMHSMKGASFLFGYVKIGEMAHAMESSMEPLRSGTHLVSKGLINSLFKAIGMVEEEIQFIKAHHPEGVSDTRISELVAELNRASKDLETINKEVVKMAEIQRTVATLEQSEKEKEAESSGSIRVPVSLLDNLMTLVGEMVLVRNQVLQFSNDSEDLNFLNLSKRLNVVTSEIQGEMMKTRMQPIGNILNKFQRVVRDLSQELNKNIVLNLSGTETELDKTLLEAIKDPLTHIVRNSCDHGIEVSATRRELGKPESGVISIRSYHEGGQVVIEVTDDGRGLNKENLVKKAIEKGLLEPSKVAFMSEKEIFNLIFAPGFSTAAAITNVSGRGVGMDVVRTNIEKIGGTVELNSVCDKGTTIKIKIPLTLAIVPALIVKCKQEMFAIPQVKLEELLRVDQSSAEHKIEYLHGAPVFRLRGKILPLVDLNRVLGFESSLNANQTVNNIAVLNADQCSFGLIVDEIQDTADIVVKPVNRLLKSLQVYSGATILGDGGIALILDIHGISKVARIGGDRDASAQANLLRAEQKRASDLQEFLIVRVNSPTKHAIVLGYVHRLEEFKASDIEYSGKQRLIRYGKTILPILSVGECLGYGIPTGGSARGILSVVVIQKAGVLYGLEVDEIVDTLSTDAEVDTLLNKQPGLFGNLNTPDGLIVAIDPFEIIASAFPATVVPIRSEKIGASVSVLNQARGLKILFVEDTVFFRRAVSIVLEKEGYDVTIALDGRDAVEILDRNPDKFDLIISDIEMPRMNGFELARAIRSNQRFSGLPLLALSSRADRKYAEMGIESGFNVYLEKLKPAILLDAIQKLVSDERRSA